MVDSSPYSIKVLRSVCGNGARTGGEEWDDGNIVSGDGWGSSWTVETGWKWTGGNSSTKDSCVEVWGDGKRFNTNSTYWDDGNTDNGDGWSSKWEIESDWTWTGGSTTTKDKCTESMFWFSKQNNYIRKAYISILLRLYKSEY